MFVPGAVHSAPGPRKDKEMEDLKEIIVTIVAWMLAMLAVAAVAIFAIWGLRTVFALSDQEVQCTSIEGAKWSGENCYKNGIRLKFDGSQSI